MGAMRTVTVVAGKDLRQQLRSGTLLIFAVVLPLGLALLFNTILGGEQQFRARYAVLDEDRGALAASFTDQVLTPLATLDTFEVTPVQSREQAVRRTDEGEFAAAFVIPAGFTEAVQAGRPATLTVIGNPDAGIAVQIAREIARSYTTELRSVQLAVATAARGDPATEPAELAARAAAMAPPVVLEADPSAGSRQLDSPTYFAAGMSVFFLFFTAMLSVSQLLAERQEGTMARLLAAPVTRTAVLAGKLLATVGIGLAAMAVLVGSSSLLLGADWGDPRGLIPLVVSAVLAATALMTLVGSFATTTEQATNWMSVLAVLFGLFGGSFVPLAQLGNLGVVSYFTPHRWFLQGLSDLASGDPTVALTPTLVLTGIAAAALTLTMTRIGRVIRP